MGETGTRADPTATGVVEVGPEAVRRSVARSVDVALREEARRNEGRVAIVRVLCYALVLLVDAGLWLAGIRPASNLAMSGGMVLISAGVLVALERLPFRAWLRFVIPVLDALLIERILSVRALASGLTPSLAATSALACGLLASTGGIRFDRKSAAWTTLLAGALAWAVLGRHTPISGMLYTTCAILGIGLLNLWLSDLVRRSMEGVRSRAFLSRFLPRTLVDQAFRDPLEALATPRVVEATVLVTDLRGFTAMSESLPPAEVLSRLSDVQGALASAVQRHGGTVDKFMGDGMLAVFGAPEPAPDHAARALACAASIRRAVARVSASHGGAPLRIGVGIHTGPLVAGCLGGGDRLEFTVLGYTVNVASRLEALTKELGAEILVSEATAAAAGRTDLPSLGEVAVRGRQARLGVYGLG